MSEQVKSQAHPQISPAITSTPTGLLQRKCDCGGSAGLAGECAACQKKKFIGGKPPLIEPKLRIGQLNDRYEQEADRVANQVMRMPEPEGRTDSGADQHGGKISSLSKSMVQRRANETRSPSGNIAPIVSETLKSPGKSLDSGTRNFMESRFGQNFSQVRIHTDTKAAESARSVNARAFTLGRDIVFGQGQYSSRNSTGRGLLAHELTHVTQQGPNVIRRAPLPKSRELKIADPEVPSPIKRIVGNKFEGTIIKLTVFFEENRFVLDEKNFRMVDRLRKVLEAISPLAIRVDTHASTKGSEEDNKTLTDLRRSAIVTFLKAESAGFPQLSGQSHGEEMSALSEKEEMPSEDLKAKQKFDRRADIVIQLPKINLGPIDPTDVADKIKKKEKVLVIPPVLPSVKDPLAIFKGDVTSGGPPQGDPVLEEDRRKREETDKIIRRERILTIPLEKIPDVIKFFRD